MRLNILKVMCILVSVFILSCASNTKIDREPNQVTNVGGGKPTLQVDSKNIFKLDGSKHTQEEIDVWFSLFRLGQINEAFPNINSVYLNQTTLGSYNSSFELYDVSVKIHGLMKAFGYAGSEKATVDIIQKSIYANTTVYDLVLKLAANYK